MAAPAWLTAAAPAIAQGGLSIGGNILSSINARNENRWQRGFSEEMWHKENEYNYWLWQQQNQYNESIWHQQNAYNEKMWQQMNAYNSPGAQMQRYRDSGLNPNLIYGQSNSTSPVASAQFGRSSADSAKHMGYSPIHHRFDMDSGIMAYFQAKESSARTNNLEAQNAVLKQEVIAKALDNVGRGTKNEADRINLENLKKYSADAAELDFKKKQQDVSFGANEENRKQATFRANLMEIAERVQQIRTDRQLKEVQKELLDWETQLRKAGGNPNDNWLFRQLQMRVMPVVDQAQKMFRFKMEGK